MIGIWSGSGENAEKRTLQEKRGDIDSSLRLGANYEQVVIRETRRT